MSGCSDKHVVYKQSSVIEMMVMIPHTLAKASASPPQKGERAWEKRESQDRGGGQGLAFTWGFLSDTFGRWARGQLGADCWLLY